MSETPQQVSPPTSRVTPKALIIGGGIAGPVMAMFLQRIGVQSTIYEAKDASDDPAGLFLTISSSGLRVLKALGIDEKVAARGTHTTGVVLWSSRGKRLGEVRHAQHEDLVSGSLVIKRGVLHQTLRDEALSRGIPIEFDKRLTNIDTADQTVVAHFEDGSQTKGDLLIGCDGVRSKTRQIIAPHIPPPNFRELICCGGIAFGSFATQQLNVLNLTLGAGATFGYLTQPSGETVWLSYHPFPGNPTSAEIASIPQEEWRQRLLGLHGNDPEPISDIINSSQGTIKGVRMYDGISPPTWHSKRVVLVGDAAHATLPHAGQGASMALESAMILTKCLRDIPDTERAFTAYHELRRPRTDKLAKLADRNGRRIVKSTPIKIWLRDMIAPVLLRTIDTSRSRDWIFSYKIDWDEKIHA